MRTTGVVVGAAVVCVALSTRTLAVPWPVDVPHNDTSIGGNYLDYRSRMAGGQPAGELGTFHHAVDIIAPAGEPVRAVADGFVVGGQDRPTEEELTTGRSRLHFRPEWNPYFHRFDVADVAGNWGGPLWAYLHVTSLGRGGNPRKPWFVDDQVTAGEVIGKVAEPTSDWGFGFKVNPHVHLSRRMYPTLTAYEWDAVGLENPLALLDGYTDSHHPRIPGGDGGISELRFRENEPSTTYFTKTGNWWNPSSQRSYKLRGQVDIIANIDDWSPESWKAEAGPYLVGYQLVRANWDGTSFEDYPEIVTFEATRNRMKGERRC